MMIAFKQDLENNLIKLPTRTIDLQIDTYGRKAKYGGYKIARKEYICRDSREWYATPKSKQDLLARAGWEAVKRTQTYAYMKAPEGQGKKRPVLEVEVPQVEPLLALARTMHEKGRPWRGLVSGWPAEYTPPTYVEPSTSIVMTTSGDDYTEESEGYWRSAHFEVGSDAWSVALVWDEDGNERVSTRP